MAKEYFNFRVLLQGNNALTPGETLRGLGVTYTSVGDISDATGLYLAFYEGDVTLEDAAKALAKFSFLRLNRIEAKTFAEALTSDPAILGLIDDPTQDDLDESVNKERNDRVITDHSITITGPRTINVRIQIPLDYTHFSGLYTIANERVRASDTTSFNLEDANGVIQSLTPTEMLELAAGLFTEVDDIYLAGTAIRNLLVPGPTRQGDVNNDPNWP